MKDEIKEILEDVKRHLDYVEATKQASIRDNEMKVMYNHITNLQEELKSANESITWWQNRFNALQEENFNYKKLGFKHLCDKNKELEDKIDKAIETIDLLMAGAYTEGNVSYWGMPCCNERLKIVKNKLQGSDEE